MLVADAPPARISPALRTCLTSRIAESFPPIVTVFANTTPLSLRVNVPAVAAVFATIILVTTVVVLAGTVYRVVVVVVVAAPRKSAFDTVAINYYLQIKLYHMDY
jgi:hypothetical protein